MSYVFRLHKTQNPNLKGWESSGKLSKDDIRTIPDTIKKGITSKLGSSIPTPFARMYLFEAAFQIVSKSAAVGNTMYHHLVSDCLDMFQFIFVYANDPKLTFKKWNKSERLTALKGSNVSQHQKLGETLELFFEGEKFKDTTEIYLIYWENKLLGGTSPLTGFYVSPNWKRTVIENGWEFKMANGDILFDEVPYALHERDNDFQLYMYRYAYAYNHIISEQSEAFFSYFHEIKKTFNRVDELLLQNEVDNDYTPKQFQQHYDAIKVDPNNEQSTEVLYSGQCAILKPKADDVVKVIQQSDFLIKTTRKYYAEVLDKNDTPIKVNAPLVLISGNHKLKYVDAIWDENVPVPDYSETALFKRKLPGLNYTYPYVTTGDFLEETLVELPFVKNKTHFFTGFNGNFKYLLPIRKEYFSFFTLDDLKKQLTILQSETRVQVSLKIPIAAGSHIEFRRNYDLNDENCVLKPSRGSGFNLGIFPFYKIVDEVALNKYSVALTYNIDGLSVGFYQFDKMIKEGAVACQSKVRTKGTGGRDFSSEYFDIDKKSFDCIEVSIGDVVPVKGLIVPLLKPVYANQAREGKQFNFAIDFGTSNTHVVYDTVRQQHKITAFDITSVDRQMVLLSSLGTGTDKSLQRRIVDGAGEVVQTIELFDSECAPSFINNEAQASFPIRTSICEHHSYIDGEANLFTNINIGFGLETDQSLGENEYFTNIKWLLNSNKTGKAKERVEAFFRQILWLIKNKILLNEGSLQSHIIWMVPLSMKRKMRGTFKNIWEKQVKAVFGENNQVTLEMKYESIVPYYALEKLRKSNDVVNIDIGGGTTDILFWSKRKETYYSTSFRFAGNDIWGEGLEESRNYKDNGFFTMIADKLEANEINLNSSNNLRPVYDSFVNNNTLDSADICAFLFKYDRYFGFSDHIKDHQPLSSILMIHLSAIIYHIAQIIKTKKATIPQYISFTGKGSEYIKLLGESEDINDLVIKLLEVFTGQEASATTKVVIADNPKVLTAVGAINEKYIGTDENISKKVENIVHIGVGTDPKFQEVTTEAGDNAVPSESVKKPELKPLEFYDVERINELSKHSREHFMDFLNHLRSRELIRLFKEYEIKFRYNGFDVLQFVEEYSQDSFAEMALKAKEENEIDDELEETLFFWYLKDVLYPLSQKMYAIKS